MHETTIPDDIAVLWDRVEQAEMDAGGEPVLDDFTDAEVRTLHLWCYDHDILLPPAEYIAAEAGKRELT